MRKEFYIFILVVLMGTSLACETLPPVAYTPMGTMMITTYSANKLAAIQDAHYIADKTCRKKHQSLVIVNEDQQYQGSVGEQVKATANVIENVAWALGSSQAASAVGSVNSNTDYKVTVEFLCQ